MSARVIRLLLFTIICISAGCANITTPTGGKRDKIPPKLVSIDPADSLLNTRVSRIEMHFNEYITVSDAAKEVQISPILSIAPTVTGLNKHVIVKIKDTLLEDNTTYRISFGSAIKDLHEGNAFKNYTYTFTTGAYFDSLELHGTVINAATGLPDTGGISVVLYSATEKDSAVVRHKPKYITNANASGAFTFKGLPKRSFTIYAIKDANGNLIYDGPEAGEMIAFTAHNVLPGDTSVPPVNLRLFAEVPDTATKKKMDSTDNKRGPGGLSGRSKPSFRQQAGLSYSVGVDTSSSERRTFDVTKPLDIVFNNVPVLLKEKITLSYDSLGYTVTPDISIAFDSIRPSVLHIKSRWSEDQVYTLKLHKGFAKDTAGVEVMPGRFVFRTKNDDDYGKIKVHLPGKYNAPKYVLLVTADKDTIYQKPVLDTIINLVKLRPDKYTFRIIVDKNGNGKWDSGDLFAKLQPEEVIPGPDPVTVKMGWDNTIDFEQKPKPRFDSKPDKPGAK